MLTCRWDGTAVVSADWWRRAAPLRVARIETKVKRGPWGRQADHFSDTGTDKDNRCRKVRLAKLV